MGADEIVWLSCTTSADVCIAVAILYALLRHKTGYVFLVPGFEVMLMDQMGCD